MPPQTPEELQFISNVAHWVEGGIVGVVALLCLAEALGYGEGRARYLWPGLILTAWLFLPPYLLLQSGVGGVGAAAGFLLRDAQQREHLLMAGLLLWAGAAEVLRRAGVLEGGRWRFVWPAALLLLGAVFAAHTQYGTPEAVAWSRTWHLYAGGTIALAGVLKTAEALWGRKFRWLAFPWTVVLLIAALLLVTYREPAGAFRTSRPGRQQAAPEG